ncbi:MAG: hypothetical protein RR971_04100 [Alistipes sp.]
MAMIISKNTKSYPINTITRVVRNHMRLVAEDGELYSNALRCVKMAFDIAELYTNRIIVSCNATFGYNVFAHIVELPTAPISDIINISYYDSTDNLQILDAGSYKLSASENRSLVEFATLPDLSPNRTINRLLITAKCGYGDYLTLDGDERDTLPPLPGFIEAATQLLAGTLFDADGDVIIGRQVNALPITAQRLLNNYKLSPYGEDL